MTSSSGGIQPVNTQRKLIRTVSMNLETMEFDELMESIDKKVTELDGYIENSDFRQQYPLWRRKKPEKRPDYGPYPVRPSVCLYNGGGG